MASERVQRRIDHLLDQTEEAVDQLDWERVHQLAEAVLDLDPDNKDAGQFIAAAERNLSRTGRAGAASAELPADALAIAAAPTPDQPTSFSNGRYQVKKFLGEGGKKRVYLAQDTLLDREVAFALIKTEGLDEVSRTRITPEAQAMGFTKYGY